MLRGAIFCALVFFGGQLASVSAGEKSPNGDNSCGAFGYELLTGRMEYLEDRFVQQQSVIEKLNDQIDRNSKSLDEIRKQNDHIVSLLTNMNANLSLSASNGKHCGSEKVFRSCSEEPSKTSGQYLLQPEPIAGEDPFSGYCEQQAFGGGWLVFHYRFDGMVNFDRNWDDYRSGFGAANGEFWLGFEKLHRITKARKHILLVQVETFDGRKGYAKYDGFEIGSERENFSLKKLGNYSGTAGDSLDRQRGMSFTTNDRDNDPWKEGNCAVYYEGAWWHNWSSNSNLNGPYGWVKRYRANFWIGFTNDKAEGLKVTKMMIREA